MKDKKKWIRRYGGGILAAALMIMFTLTGALGTYADTKYGVSDDRAENTVGYNAKNAVVNGTYAEPADTENSGTFAGWNTKADGTGQSITASEAENPTIASAFYNSIGNGQTAKLYAQWTYGTKVKYAVSVYGINHDLQGNGTAYTKTVTFGPAQGDYTKTEKAAHVAPASETSSNKCIHNHSWSEIIAQAKEDPTVFNSCISNGCTKTVDLSINDTLVSDADTVGKYYANETGDGPGELVFELKDSWKVWNPQADYAGASSNEKNYGTNRGGWPASRVRAVLNGSEVLTEHAASSGDSNLTANAFAYANGQLRAYARSDANQKSDSGWRSFNSNTAVKDISQITASNCLLSCFPKELQSAILPKAVINGRDYYSTSGSTQTTYDKLWLFSLTEMHNYSGYGGTYYSGRSTRYSYYVYSGGSSSGSYILWLRSPSRNYAYRVCYSNGNYGDYNDAYSGSNGLAPGFVIGQ